MSGAAIVILAGGQGVRMGGGKPQRLWRGRRLIDRALELAHAYGDCVAIAVRDKDQVIAHGEIQLIDSPEIAGPLAGLERALRFARDSGGGRVLTIACDCPLLPENLLEVLSAAMAPDTRVALAQSYGRLHPVCGLWDVRALEAVRPYYDSGRSSLRGFAQEIGVTIVDWGAPAHDPFANANTPEELALLQAG
jgi:molybdenum cofactor guanylyltransferase